MIFLCTLFSLIHDLRFIVAQLMVMYDYRCEVSSSDVTLKCILSVFDSFEANLRCIKYYSAFSESSLYNPEDVRQCDCCHC